MYFSTLMPNFKIPTDFRIERKIYLAGPMQRRDLKNP